MPDPSVSYWRRQPDLNRWRAGRRDQADDTWMIEPFPETHRDFHDGFAVCRQSAPTPEAPILWFWELVLIRRRGGVRPKTVSRGATQTNDEKLDYFGV